VEKKEKVINILAFKKTNKQTNNIIFFFLPTKLLFGEENKKTTQ